MRKRNYLAINLVAVGLTLAMLATPFPAKPSATPRIIEITAKRFGFSPGEITLKRGETVTLRFGSQDVKHGFFSKALKLDADIVPGKTTELTFTPETAGKFVTVCDNFCGAGHGDMRMTIVVQ